MTGSESVGVSTPDLDSIEKHHSKVEWSLCGEDGTADLGQPLPPFCAACSDEEYVGAVEYGDTIDEAADVVSWPCTPVLLVGEVRRLQTQLTELREHIANEIEADGREVVQFLAGDKTHEGRVRLIGAEDAYKDAIRIARGVAETPEDPR